MKSPFLPAKEVFKLSSYFGGSPLWPGDESVTWFKTSRWQLLKILGVLVGYGLTMAFNTTLSRIIPGSKRGLTFHEINVNLSQTATDLSMCILIGIFAIINNIDDIQALYKAKDDINLFISKSFGIGLPDECWTDNKRRYRKYMAVMLIIGIIVATIGSNQSRFFLAIYHGYDPNQDFVCHLILFIISFIMQFFTFFHPVSAATDAFGITTFMSLAGRFKSWRSILAMRLEQAKTCKKMPDKMILQQLDQDMDLGLDLMETVDAAIKAVGQILANKYYYSLIIGTISSFISASVFFSDNRQWEFMVGCVGFIILTFLYCIRVFGMCMEAQMLKDALDEAKLELIKTMDELRDQMVIHKRMELKSKYLLKRISVENPVHMINCVVLDNSVISSSINSSLTYFVILLQFKVANF